MERIEGTLARTFDFDGETTPQLGRGGRTGLWLAPHGGSGSAGRLMGPDKYKVLEHRRRQAQIRARRALDLVDLMETGR